MMSTYEFKKYEAIISSESIGNSLGTYYTRYALIHSLVAESAGIPRYVHVY